MAYTLQLNLDYPETKRKFSKFVAELKSLTLQRVVLSPTKYFILKSGELLLERERHFREKRNEQIALV